MALARVKTWSSGEVLTASDLNAEFNNILNNAVSLLTPLTGSLDLDGYALTVDSAAVTTLTSTSAIGLSYTTGAKSGTPGTTGSIANFSAHTFTDSATAGSGTATAYTGFSLQRPTLAASNASVTTTDAATFYIPNNVAAGTNETLTASWAIWVDAGNVRFDDDIYWRSGTAFSGILAHNNSAARTYTFPDSSGTVALTSDTTWLPIGGGTLTGNLLFTDATYDIGASGATRPRDLFLSRNATIGGTLGVTGVATLASPVFNTQVSGTAIAAQSDVDAGTSAVKILVPSLRKISLLATQATTSGTEWDFTIPAGAREITVHFVGFSTNGTSNICIQLGDAGGIETTGYNSYAYHAGIAFTNSTADFLLTAAHAAADVVNGYVTFKLVATATFQWLSQGMLQQNSTGTMSFSTGNKALSAELTTVRVKAVNGTDAGDAGLVGCSYIL